MRQLRSPRTDAGTRLLTDLTDLDTTGASPTSMFLGPHGVRRAILAIEAEAASRAVTETPEGLDVERLARAIATVGGEHLPDVVTDGRYEHARLVAASYARLLAHKEEHSPKPSRDALVEDVQFGIAAINDPDVLGDEGKERLRRVAAALPVLSLSAQPSESGEPGETT